MKKKILETWRKADDIILRYPMVLVMALIAALSAVVAIEMDGIENPMPVMKLIITGCLGISMMYGVKMLSQRIGKGWILELAGTAFLIGLYFYLPEHEREFTEVYAYLLIPLFILSHLFVSFASYLNHSSELKFWQYNKNLFINIFLTAVFTGVLVLGVILAILAVDNLFDLKLDDRLYPKTASFLGIFASCFIFLLFSDRGLPDLENTNDYPQILKFFTQFILIPLLIIYLIILYFYAGKILLNWELPRGWVSYLILAYSVVGILALLLVHPLKSQDSKSWVKLFSKIFYYTLIPLLVLLFVAINTRILEYGYTEPRYFVLLIALWLTTVVAYFILFRNATIKFIPVSLFIFGACAITLPWLNAFAVAKRSQQNELAQILEKHQLVENGKINFAKSISQETADDISNKFNFLYQRKVKDQLLQYLSETQRKELQRWARRNNHIEWQINSFFTNTTNSATKKILSLTAEPVIFDIKGFDYATELTWLQREHIILDGDRFHLINNPYQQKYLFIINDSQRYDLTPFFKKTAEKYRSRQIAVDAQELTHEFDLGNYHIKIMLSNFNQDFHSEDYYYFEQGFVFIKLR